VLDRIATFVEPALLVGDVNIHLEALTNANTAQFVDVLAAHGLASRVTSATAAYWTWWLAVPTYRRRTSMCLTSVCRTTDSCGGRRR